MQPSYSYSFNFTTSSWLSYQKAAIVKPESYSLSDKNFTHVEKQGNDEFMVFTTICTICTSFAVGKVPNADVRGYSKIVAKVKYSNASKIPYYHLVSQETVPQYQL